MTWVQSVLKVVAIYAILKFCFSRIVNYTLGRFRASQPLTKRFGKWAVVTGSTDGIGLEGCKVLAKEGVNLYLISRNPERLENAKRAMKEANSAIEVKTFTFDFSHSGWDDGKFKAMVEEIRKLDVGILWNNVGMAYDLPDYFETLTEQAVDDIISVNLRSAYKLTHGVIPQLKSQKRGAILFTSSAAAAMPTDPMIGAYGGAKAGVSSLADSLRVELVHFNVVVECHEPLAIVSKLSKLETANVFVESAAKYAAAAIDTLKTGVPSYLGRSRRIPTWSHQLQHWAIWFMPSFVWNMVFLHATKLLRDRELIRRKTKE